MSFGTIARMTSRLIALALVATLALVHKVPGAAAQTGMQAFDVALMTDAERRAVQAALALSGDYIGLVDGVWGPRSMRALGEWSARQGHPGAPRMRDVGRLMSGFVQRLADEGWTMVYLDRVGYSVAIPGAILAAPSPAAPSEVRAPDGSLVFGYTITDARGASAFHQSALAQAAPGTEPDHYTTSELALTSVIRPGGGRSYLRTVRAAGGSLTFSIQSEVRRNDVLALMAGTLVPGFAPQLTIPQDGVVAAAMDTVPPPPPSRDIVGTILPEPGPPQDAPARTQPGGTAFYVNGGTLVTAHHVVAGCRRIELRDGTELSVIASDPQVDLAALAAPQTPTPTVVIDRTVSLRLGQPARALGYSDRDILDGGLILTPVSIRSLGNLANPARRMSLSIELGRGNGGGPLLADDATVLGVMVGGPDAATAPPGRIDAAVPSQTLVGFLDAIGVEIPPRPPWRLPDSPVVPQDLVEAIVPVVCR